PPAEAAWYRFKQELPEKGRQTLPGSMARAVQLAMDHFLPWNIRPPSGADAVDICIRQRQPWDVEVAPWGEGIMLVRFALGPGTCRWGGAPLLDMGATYAVDVREGRIVAIQSPLAPPEPSAPFEFPADLPRQSLRHMVGNTAAAIELAVADFLSRQVQSPAVSDEERCLSRLESYVVMAAPEPDGVMLVRFDVDDAACPPPGPPDLVEGRKVLPPAFVTTYAVDLRTLRILGINLTTRQRIVE
ncbi:MAG TPA: hypothetical protein VLQ93_17860, partial [Myxococcaceae bacterium]|nr:hypothetical protein [Myxococcaceae bacterium]